MKHRSVSSKTACSRLLAVSSGQKRRKLPPPSARTVAAYRSRISRPAVTVFSTMATPGASTSTA